MVEVCPDRISMKKVVLVSFFAILSVVRLGAQQASQLVQRAQSKTDQLFATDKKGNIITSKSITLSKGVLGSDNIIGRNLKVQDGSLRHYNVYQSNSKSEATNLFKVAANNSNVEWGLNRFADGQNFITTTHNPTGNEGSIGLFYDKSLNITSPLVEQIHSHPGGIHEPSGRVSEGSAENRGGDIGNAKFLDRMYPNSTIKYSIYTPSDGRMTPYTSKTFMPPLPEIIIRPEK